MLLVLIVPTTPAWNTIGLYVNAAASAARIVIDRLALLEPEALATVKVTVFDPGVVNE